MDLIDKIKAIAKDGVDFAEIEKEIAEQNPLNGVKTKDDAWKFIKDNDILLSTLDQKVTERGNSMLENFKSDKMEALIKEREEAVRKEFIKDETPEMKRIRELEEKDAMREKEIATRDLQDNLSIKAKEIGFDPIRAKEYAVYGEKAIERLEQDANWFKTTLEEQVGKQIKENYGGIKPPTRKAEIKPADLDEQIREARSRGDSAAALRLQIKKDSQPAE